MHLISIWVIFLALELNQSKRAAITAAETLTTLATTNLGKKTAGVKQGNAYIELHNNYLIHLYYTFINHY